MCASGCESNNRKCLSSSNTFKIHWMPSRWLWVSGLTLRLTDSRPENDFMSKTNSKTTKRNHRSPARAAVRVQPLVRNPVSEAYDQYRTDNPQIFDCTTLNMHPAHHRYLANRLQDAFESGWKAARMPNAQAQRPPQ